MKTKLKTWQITLLAIFAVMFAAIASIFSLKADTVDEEETPEELVDNWELGIVFYDSFVDNGMIDSEGNYVQTQCKTPLTSINWDASDNGYGVGETRIITMQINYDNDNAVTTYQPGELKITIPNIFYSNMWGKDTAWQAQLATEVTIGANDSTHTKYAWTVVSSKENFVFTNTNIIEEKTNFEGSIQVVAKITPKAELTDNKATSEPEIEVYLDECTHTYNKQIQANLTYDKIVGDVTEQISINSNELSFNYTRTYIHPWKKNTFTIEKIANKVSAPDGLPEGCNDYIWVNYRFNIRGLMAYKSSESYPYISMSFYVYDLLPEGCLVLSSDMQPVTLENNVYKSSSTLSSGSSLHYNNFYVGYPKSIYNEEAGNLNITNHIDLYVKFYTEEEYSIAAYADVSLNLAEFDFTYPDDLYSVSKWLNDYDGNLYSRFLLLPNFTHTCGYCSSGGHASTCIKFSMSSTAIYTGTPMTVRHGDDLLYITDSNGNYRRLTEDEYFFDYIQLPDINNRNNVKIPYSKYPINLYVKYTGNTNYELFMDLSTKSSGQEIYFPQDKKVVAWYIEIKDANESVYFSRSSTTNAYFYGTTGVHIKPLGNISTSGTIYNFAFTEVFFKDENGNLVLQNEPVLDDYATLITQDNIANYDLNTYGHYMQRATKSKNYTEYGAQRITNEITASKKMSSAIQNSEEETFTSTGTIGFKLGNDFKIMGDIDENYLNHVVFPYSSDHNFITSFKVYDLLPKGMDLINNEEELLNRIYITASYYTYFYNKDGTKPFNSNQELIDFMKEHSEITITNNYNKTGRTKIEWSINFPNNPMLFAYKYSNALTFTISYDTKISYDNFIEFGNTYKNHVYVEELYENTRLNIGIVDDGRYDGDAADINNNNNTSEKMVYSSATLKITSVVSTHQDVTTYVKTDQSNYSTGIVDASNSSEYEYKLRVRTGSSNVTNLVIYTSIEEAQQGRSRWKGEFLGVDTTYAENKGYSVNIWYSPNKTVGTLAEDTSWQVYDESTVDKSKVKSLAFQYLDSSGTAATLPANSLTYVLIKMRAPADESETRLARNNCWTEWNAIDEFGGIVDGIIGINSNVVKVALPNSVKTDDLPSISLKFTKEITGSETAFEKMGLNKANEQLFIIRLTSLTANDDGSYNQVTGMLSSNTGLIISQIPIGTYLLEELGDNYFDFVDFTNNNDPEIVIEGVTFEKTDQGYIITVSEDLTENIEFNIKVTNEIEDERFFEDKNNEKNLFLINKTGIDHNTPEG